MPAPLLIDTDNALGSNAGDVDDGFAIAALLRSGLPVAGLSSVAGNTGEAAADRNNRTLGALCGHGGRGYGGPFLRGVAAGDVVERVDRRLDLWSGEPVRVAALGPLTNVAAALRALDQQGLRPSVSEIVLVGGGSRPGGARAPSPGIYPWVGWRLRSLPRVETLGYVQRPLRGQKESDKAPCLGTAGNVTTRPTTPRLISRMPSRTSAPMSRVGSLVIFNLHANRTSETEDQSMEPLLLDYPVPLSGKRPLRPRVVLESATCHLTLELRAP